MGCFKVSFTVVSSLAPLLHELVFVKRAGHSAIGLVQ